MIRKQINENDFYVISDDFRVLYFNDVVKEGYPGIQVGDICYKVRLNRDEPCLHCPLTGNTDEASPVFFDSKRGEWVQAVFSRIEDGKYAVNCLKADEREKETFDRLEAKRIIEQSLKLEDSDIIDMGVLGGYCEEGVPFYYINKKMISMLGYDDEEEVFSATDGMFVNLVHPDDRGRISVNNDYDFYEGMSFENHYRMLKKNGDILWIIDRSEIIKDIEGKLAMMCVCMNVTNIYENEHMKRTLNTNRIFLSAMPPDFVACAIVNLTDGTQVRLLREGDKIHEVDVPYLWDDFLREVINAHMTEPEQIQYMQDVGLLHMLQKKKPGDVMTFNYYTSYQSPDGAPQPVSTTLTFFEQDGKPYMTIFTTGNMKIEFEKKLKEEVDKLRRHDLAQREIIEREMRKAEAANKAKTDFLFNMSHDIRTPMNAIIGFTDLLSKHIDEREHAENYISKIKDANYIMLSLINNVLEMARIESGKESLKEEPVSAREMMSAMHTMFEPQIEAKRIHLIRNLDVEHPIMMADSTKLGEIFLNLLSNALKYTPEGGEVRLDITESQCYRKGYSIYKAVISDNGIGMSEEFLPHLFEPFARERSSTASKTAGTGLGMPIVKKLIELMHGTISVESTPGKGTTFTVEIPFRYLSEEADGSTEGDNLASGSVDFSGRRILLAEDNDLNAEIAITILEDAGFSVDHARDGSECIDILGDVDENYYDIVLMDVQMPNVDGYYATRCIREMNNKKKSEIPVIAMTANAFEEDRRNAFEAGMDDHIAKPVDVAKLLAILEKHLK